MYINEDCRTTGRVAVYENMFGRKFILEVYSLELLALGVFSVQGGLKMCLNGQS